MRQTPEATQAIPFPEQPGASSPPVPLELRERTRFVETTPNVGFRGVTLTYWDEEHIPRWRQTFDESFTPDMIERARRLMQKMGDALPPLRPPTPVLLPTPRLLS